MPERLEIADLGDLAPGFDILACGRSETIRIDLGDEEARPRVNALFTTSFYRSLAGGAGGAWTRR